MAVGSANTGLHFLIINALSISFGIYSGGKLALINGSATAIVLCQSYVLNKYWTFSSANGCLGEFSRFLLVNAGAALLHSGVVYAVTTFVPRPLGVSPLLWENAAAAMGLGAVVLWNFTGFRLIVFAPAGEREKYQTT